MIAKRIQLPSPVAQLFRMLDHMHDTNHCFPLIYQIHKGRPLPHLSEIPHIRWPQVSDGKIFSSTGTDLRTSGALPPIILLFSTEIKLFSGEASRGGHVTKVAKPGINY